MSDYITIARKLRPIIEQAAQSLDDKTASEAPTLQRGMTYDGSLIEAGTKINWGGVVKKAAVDLWDTESNNPDNAPTLWDDIAYHDGIRIIPENFTSTTSFSLDELGWQDGHVYRSLMDGNVYPVTQADAWVLVK